MSRGSWGQLAVYPRVCGGTPFPFILSDSVYGLSPRVRGNLGHGRWAAIRPGSIPACAGEPLPQAPRARHCTVYPRVCGGTMGNVWKRQDLEGLSPRVRGNLGVVLAGAILTGSIPACAGEPCGQDSASQSLRVYPRVCGGTRLTVTFRALTSGLSPRVRGNPSRNEVRIDIEGSIPACAGEPSRRPSR